MAFMWSLAAWHTVHAQRQAERCRSGACRKQLVECYMPVKHSEQGPATAAEACLVAC
jgi:hypothetical protein